jgi:fatty-acyl-CoA synthase
MIADAASAQAPTQTANAPAGRSVSKAWMRALELTASIAKNPERLLSTIVDEQAAGVGESPALVSDRESFTYRGLASRMHQYARWALAAGVGKGDVVCLLMPNRPEYLAIWLGITSVGGVVSLLNTNLVGASLAHCVDAVSPTHMIVAAEYRETLQAALSDVQARPVIWTHGWEQAEYRSIDQAINGYAGDGLRPDEQRKVTVEDRALYIYTSGTTGLPKAAKVSHARVLQWSLWFAGMMEAQPSDRMYNTLPMYHSVGGVQATGAMLVTGGSVAIREKFSASQFWSDVVRWDCTVFQYIGELCRYLLKAPDSGSETAHRIRLACGNGMAPEVWEEFEARFHIPQVLEFYASTEGGVSLFNVQGKRGAIGHIPPYLAHRFSPALVKFDVDAGEPVRDENGLCVRCAVNEAGEALGKLVDDPANIGSHFEGYATEAATEKKILRNVFKPGDCWIRTGDLMRKDEKGFFYFVDRIGDTFRWKGENVATSEVAEVLSSFPGVAHAIVYGVAVPGADGRAGMATLVATEELDVAALRAHIDGRLPAYARPLFLRMRQELDVTGTFKYAKTELVREGFDPAVSMDRLYFYDVPEQCFKTLDLEAYERIQEASVRF